MYRKIQTFAFKVFRESSSWPSGNDAVQMFFLTPNRNMSAGKFVNWESFLAVFWEHIIFNFKRVDIRKISEVFWAKTHCNMGDLFRWFLLGLRFSAINSGINLMMSTGTGRIKLYARNNILLKKLQIWDLGSFIFWSKFRFCGAAWGVFFLIFRRRSNMVAEKKLPTTL